MTTTHTQVERAATARAWSAAVGGGVAGGIAMGALLDATTNMMPTLGALYGQPTVLGGWAAHLFISVVFAIAFTVAVRATSLREYAETTAALTGFGLGYGGLLGVVTEGLVLPLAVGAVGTSTLPVTRLGLPDVAGPFAFAVVFALSHLVYGVVLGAVFGATLTAPGVGGSREATAVSDDPVPGADATEVGARGGRDDGRRQHNR